MSKTNGIYFATLVFSLGWLLYNFVSLPAPIDCGDGLMHFFISQASWYEHELFLDHWGKPFFILLSSPFAQLGFWGMALFNSLVFVATILFAWATLQKLKTPLALQISLPFLLLLTTEYSNTILGGLTEPLFSLFVVLAVWAWVNERFFVFSIAVGLLPFLRSEGQLVVLIAVVMLLLSKNWKSVLALTYPFLVYSIVGFFALGDFWWYFTQSPYSMSKNAYGIGSYFHYVNHYQEYLGLHGLLLSLLGIFIGIYYLLRKKLNNSTINLALLCYGTFLGILVAHSYFYGSGQNSSMGLTRITTQGLPSLLLISLLFIGKIIPQDRKLIVYAFYLLPALLVIFLCTTPYLKKEENRMNTAVLAMGDYIKTQNELNNKNILAYHPLIAYAIESNVKITTNRVKEWWGTYLLTDKSSLHFGDAVVWDSQFGSIGNNITLPQLFADSNFMLCRYEPAPGNQKENGIYLFQYVPAEVKQKSNTKRIEIPIASKTNISSKNEFQDVLKINASNQTRTIQVNCSGAKKIHLVCTSTENSDYQATELTNENQTFEFVLDRNKKYHLYLWNPTLVQYKFNLYSMLEKKKVLPRLWKGN